MISIETLTDKKKNGAHGRFSNSTCSKRKTWTNQRQARKLLEKKT